MFEDSSGLSLWDRIKESIVPESQAESLVNQIYGVGGTAEKGIPDPETGNAADLSLPAVYVRAKDSVAAGVNNVTSAIQSTFLKYFIVLVAVLAVAAILYGYLPRLGSKLAK